MTNSPALEAAIAKTGISKKSLAKQLALSEMGLFRKINNITEFKASEIIAMQKILSLTDCERDSIFSSPYVTSVLE